MNDSELPSSFSLRLFGRFEAEVDGAPIGELRSRKERLALALLALAPNQTLSRVALAQSLWPAPDHSPGNARQNLRRSLMELRRALGTAASRLKTEERGMVRLNLDSGAWVDVLAFDQGGRESADTADLVTALSLYRDPLLIDFVEDACLQAARAKRHAAYISGLCRLVDAARQSGDQEQAIQYVRQAIAASVVPLTQIQSEFDAPLPSEPLYRELMLLHAECGDYNAALDAYQELSASLYRLRKNVPDTETTNVYRRLRSESLRRPVETKSVLHDGLPAGVNELFGRAEVIREVSRALDQSRLVTLTGSGGIGKTRLALEVARSVATEYSHGAYFVELGVLSDRSMIAQRIAGVLGILRGVPGQSVEELLVDFLRKRNVLLVLDNAEHLLPECAVLVARLLSVAPLLQVLATSRQALGCNGEQIWRVPSLEVPREGMSDRESVSQFLQCPSVQLFLARAAAVHPGFTVAGQDIALVGRICRCLDGIPLAIELAAARTLVLTPKEIDVRLRHRFALLTSGRSDALPRHQTLRAAVDWSFALLSPEEQTLFARLSVFAGGWTLEAAETICSGGPVSEERVLDLLTGLVEKSLVLCESHQGVTRYRLLETLKEYAAEILASTGERRNFAHRHAVFFCTLSELAEPHLKEESQDAWWQRLDKEGANLSRCLEWGIEHNLEYALRTATAVWRYWAQGGRLTEGRSWLQRVLQALDKAPQTMALENADALRARALGAAAGLAWLQYDGTAAGEWSRAAAPLAQAAGDTEYAAFSLLIQGLSIHFIERRPEAGSTLLLQGLAISQDAGDEYHAAMILDCLGLQAISLGDLGAAGRLLDNAVSVSQNVNNPWLSALTLLDQGLQRLACGDIAFAHRRIQESLRLRLACKDRWGIIISIQGLADVASAEGKMERAARLYGAAEALRDEVYMFISPIWTAQYEANVAMVRQSLGAEAFLVAWQQGRALSLEEAVVFAMEGCQGTP